MTVAARIGLSLLVALAALLVGTASAIAAPMLQIVPSHKPGTFTAGLPGQFSLGVANSGDSPTTAP